MARGWESKSVEEQIEAGNTDLSSEGKLKLTAEQAERKRRRDVLGAARTNVLRQLESSSNMRYRKLLEDELKSLATQIDALAGTDGS
jgi:hypothetical protein